MKYGLVVNKLDSVFELQSRYYVCVLSHMHNYRINSTTSVHKQGWLWHEVPHEGLYAIKTRKPNQI